MGNTIPPVMPWNMAWLIIQLLTMLFHVSSHCQWEFYTHTVIHHGHKFVTQGFLYMCG